MKAGQLKKWLEKVPDDALMVISSTDHNYKEARFVATTALRDAEGEISEDYGETITPEFVYGNRIPVIVVNP